MHRNESNQTLEVIRRAAHPVWGTNRAFDPLMDAIADKRVVMIGEASHGTHEFYSTRAKLTRRLIEERGFTAVIAEADWPDAYRVNRYVRGFHDDEDAERALEGFKRFPQWMWRNADVLEFITWMRERNDRVRAEQKAGFYGMDLYSLYGSMGAVLEFLGKVDPEAAKRARYRYGCFDHFAEDPQAYGYAAGFDLERSCEDQAIEQLMELQKRSAEYARRDGRVAEDEYFYVEQNARLVKNAEEYYRTMFSGRVSSWNLRDEHMAETVGELIDYLDRVRPGNKVVLWAHNSHLGDARATEMGEQGELNVGQLMRQRYGDGAFNIGFTTHTGTVTAASEWDGPAERKRVRPSLEGSYERLFHETELEQFFLILRGGDKRISELLTKPRLERAIGVIYMPETERVSHYFHAVLPRQFDAIIHLDTTSGVEPLEAMAEAVGREAEETYPTGV